MILSIMLNVSEHNFMYGLLGFLSILYNALFSLPTRFYRYVFHQGRHRHYHKSPFLMFHLLLATVLCSNSPLFFNLHDINMVHGVMSPIGKKDVL